MTIISTDPFPPVSQSFCKDLLSIPLKWGDDAEDLREISKYLERKMNEFKMFPKTQERLKEKLKKFLEFYGWAKIKEEQNKEKKTKKNRCLFYRIELPIKSDRTIFTRLRNRARTSNYFKLR